MLTVSKDRPLLTTTTGALPRPSWNSIALAGRPFSVCMADRKFREQYNDTLAAFFADQTRAGVDILTDGDARPRRRCRRPPLDDLRGRAHGGHGAAQTGDYPIHRGKDPGQLMFEVMETPPAADRHRHHRHGAAGIRPGVEGRPEPDRPAGQDRGDLRPAPRIEPEQRLLRRSADPGDGDVGGHERRIPSPRRCRLSAGPDRGALHPRYRRPPRRAAC